MKTRTSTKRTHSMMTRLMDIDADFSAKMPANTLEAKAGSKSAKQKREASASCYSELPLDLQLHPFQFLTKKEVVRLSAVSTFFNKQSKHYQGQVMLYHHCKDALVELGCNQNLLKSAAETAAIVNYKRLHTLLSRSSRTYRSRIDQLWELLCLSGEITAVEYAIQHEKINATTVNRWNESPLHLTAYSGNVEAMNLIIAEMPGIDPLAVTTHNWTVLHNAIASGNLEASKRAVQFLGDSNPISFKNNLLHLAVVSENPKIVLFVRKLCISHKLNVDPCFENEWHVNAFAYLERIGRNSKSLADDLRNVLTIPLKETGVVQEAPSEKRLGMR